MVPRFSSRFPDRLDGNALARARAALARRGVPLLDLTETNPTRVGLTMSADALEALADPRGVSYQPNPAGMLEARRAVADECARAGRKIDVDRIVLTASTSEAYSLLFKLLCDPGDNVLVPQPGYPLFEWLTRFDAAHARPYRLEYHGRWSIDRASVEDAIDAGTRAVLVVSPNNPTGAMLRAGDGEWLAGLCAARRVAIVADEVFAGYPLRPPADAMSLAGETRALTFTLGGLSKSAGLPQMKLSWILVSGPDAAVDAALARLSVIADTYLSVSTPVQLAAARLIAAGRELRARIRGRLDANLEALRRALAPHPSITLLEPDAGWSAVLQVPSTIGEEALALRLLEEAHVVVHPGYFFDFPREAFLVLSLLPAMETFAAAFDRIIADLNSHAAGVSPPRSQV